MTKTRMLLFTALAAVLACGICGPPVLAQDMAGEAHATAIAIGHVTDDSPDAMSPGMYQGIVAMGPVPAVSGDWPCWGGGTDCSGIAAGGLVIGEPEQLWSKTCTGCGQIYYTFQTTTANGTASISVTVTQGLMLPTTIFSFSGPVGTVSKNSILYVEVSPISFTGAVAGAATINVSTTIGSVTIRGAAKIVLH